MCLFCVVALVECDFHVCVDGLGWFYCVLAVLVSEDWEIDDDDKYKL